MKTDRLLPDSKVRERYGGVSAMTIWRWERSKNMDFPVAVVINGRKYRRESELDAFDASRPRRQEAA